MWITPYDLAFVMFSLMISYVVLFPLFFLIMALLMPRNVVERYFREPHFSRSEQAVYTAVPFSFMRVVSMAWLIAFPRFGRKRKMTDVHQYCPNWYVRLSRIFFYWCFGHGGAWLLLLLGLGIHSWLTA